MRCHLNGKTLKLTDINTDTMLLKLADTDTRLDKIKGVLYKNLSYQLWGAALEVRKNFGPGHKEKLYQEAFADELSQRSIDFEREKSIRIYNPKTGKAMRCGYQPDFIVAKKVIVELKAVALLPKREIDQLYDYLRNSQFELGYLINFAAEVMKPIRIIYTNDRKGWFKNVKP